jgi:hypothetical protein
MKWGRSADYHGSRTYDLEEPNSGWMSDVWSSFVAVGKRPFRALLKFATRSSSTTVLLDQDGPHFSLLGAGRRTGAGESAASCPFPTELKSQHDPRAWRVYP